MAHHKHRRSRSDPYKYGAWIVSLLLISLLAPLIPGPARTSQVLAAAACGATGNNGYTVQVCLNQPVDAAIVSGDQTVNATVVKSGGTVGGMAFYLDGIFIINDHTPAPYQFVLPSTRWADGTHLLEVEAVMTDGFVSPRAAVSIVFANGVSSPPVNTGSFSPATGSAPTGSPFVVAVTGDGADSGKGQVAVTDTIASWNPNMLLYLGDVYDEGTPTEFYNWYAPTWGRFRSITNPTIGNHEWRPPENDGYGYFDYWDNIPHYYSFDAAGWHFVTLNSIREFGQYEPGTPQFEWLAADLQASNAACTIVYFHNPVIVLTGSGNPVNDRFNDLWQLLVDHGVDMVFTGDVHTYQRWKPLNETFTVDQTGVTHFTVGTGGHGFNIPTGSDDRLASDIRGVNGAVRLELNSDGAGFQFISSGGATLDFGSVPCSAENADTVPPSAPANLSAAGDAGTQVDLAWTAATDNVGVTGYEVYRDGALLTTLEPATSYADASVLLSTTYTYSVKARDAAGNLSEFSEEVTVTTAGSPADQIFAPVADAYVQQANPGMNVGHYTNLRADSSPAEMTYLKFDLQGLSAPVVSATLRLYVRDGTANGPEIATSGDTSWAESAITWNNRPAVGATIGDVGQIATGSWVAYDVTSAVTGNGPLTLVLVPQSSDALSVNSRNSATDIPELVISYGSAPGTETTTATATVTSTATGTATETVTATATETVTSTATATATETVSATATAIATETVTGTVTATPTATVTETVVPGGTIGFAPIADAYVQESNPDLNVGHYTNLRADTKPNETSYLMFDVQGIAGPVTSATLRFYVRDGTANGPQVSTSADTSWTESGITWNNRPAVGAGVFDIDQVTTGTWIEVDVSSAIAGDGRVTFVLIPQSSDALSVNSRNAGADRPELVIVWGGSSATPTPTATVSETVTPSPTPTATATETATATAVATETVTATASPTPTVTPIPTATPTIAETPTAAPGGAVSFAPVADAYVQEAKPDVNVGHFTNLRSDSTPGEIAYLKFDVQGITQPITSATLRLYVRDGTANGPELAVASDSSWSESGITWNNRPGTGPVFTDTGAVSTGTWIEYDVTSAVTGNGLVTLVLVPQSSDALSVNSRNAGSERPELVIVQSGTGTASVATTTATPTVTATAALTETATATATVTATPTATETATQTATPVDTPVATETATETATSTEPPVPTETVVPTETATAAVLSAETVTVEATGQPRMFVTAPSTDLMAGRYGRTRSAVLPNDPPGRSSPSPGISLTPLLPSGASAPIHGPGRNCWDPGVIVCLIHPRPPHVTSDSRIGRWPAPSRQEGDGPS